MELWTLMEYIMIENWSMELDPLEQTVLQSYPSLFHQFCNDRTLLYIWYEPSWWHYNCWHCYNSVGDNIDNCLWWMWLALICCWWLTTRTQFVENDSLTHHHCTVLISPHCMGLWVWCRCNLLINFSYLFILYSETVLVYIKIGYWLSASILYYLST